MELNVIRKGLVVRETISNEVVYVVSIGVTKHYGPNRPVRVRFKDGHAEYYTPEDLTPIESGPSMEKSQ